MDQSTVLILSDDPEFARAVMARWQTERMTPAFTLIGGEVWNADSACYDLAIVGAIDREKLPSMIGQLEKNGRPMLVVCANAADAQAMREAQSRAMVMSQHEGWVDAVVLLCTEILRRVDAVARARRAEQSAASLQMNATLGRYMLEMRHSLNNALTSVLGNSELLLLEPGALSAPVREQVDTIRSMALRIHEILQRFSSLESELKCAQKPSDEGRPVRVAAAS